MVFEFGLGVGVCGCLSFLVWLGYYWFPGLGLFGKWWFGCLIMV